VFEFYTEDYADTMSLAVFLISLAVSVYFAEPIRAVIPINLLLLLILVHIVYVLIRWYVKGCMRSRGYFFPKTLLIRLAVKRSKGSILYNISK
jgi:hypothetical protein